MKTIGLLLGLAGIAVFGAIAWLASYAGYLNPVGLVLDSLALAKQIDVSLMGLLIVILVGGATARSSMSDFLRVVGWVAPGLGILGTAHSGAAVLIAMEHTHLTRLMVTAPSIAEALAPVALGLMVGGLALLLARPKRPRMAKA